jgi:hypothetical protein
MDGVVKMSAEERRLVCVQAEERLGLQAASIEKDFWVLDQAKVSFRTLAAERTFWEKALLLHEETFRPADKPRALRLARHYYDLWCLIGRGVAGKAGADEELFKRVAEHRQAFFPWSWVDYATMRRGCLRLLPAEGHLQSWRRDYEAMSGSMFFGKVPPRRRPRPWAFRRCFTETSVIDGRPAWSPFSRYAVLAAFCGKTRRLSRTARAWAGPAQCLQYSACTPGWSSGA